MISEDQITFGLVAFIDVLGFGGQVTRSESVTDIKACIDRIKSIQKAFDYNSQDQHVKNADELYKKRTLAFSDSILIHIPFSSSAVQYSGTLDPILMVLSQFSLAQGICVLNGTFLRGGIDLNWWYDEDDVLVSKGVVCSYALEGQANVPVLALTDKLYTHFSDHPDRATYAQEIDPVNAMFRCYPVQALDGKPIEYWYLDYLTACLENAADSSTLKDRDEEAAARSDPERREFIRSECRSHNVRSFLKEHAKAIKTAYDEAPSQATKDKYIWLADYHNNIANDWVHLENDWVHLDSETRCEL